MKRLSDLWRAIAHRVSCAAEVAGWLLFGAWMASAEEMADERGYGDWTR